MSDTVFEPSKYAARSPLGVIKKAATRAANQPSRKLGHARITEDVFPLLTKIWDPALGLLLAVSQHSGLYSSRANDGWVTLSKTVFQQLGLIDFRLRGKAVRRLVIHGILETRTSGRGASLEYRLRPVTQWTATRDAPQ